LLKPRTFANKRSYDLPDDLFEKGETKPMKPVKHKKDDKKKKTNGTKSAKRHFTETGIEVRSMRPAKNPRLFLTP
jgi:poly(A) polymerase